MTTKQQVPNMLRYYRKQAGLRQIDVAARLGLKNTDRMSHWEKGQKFPNVTNLFKLSAIYKVPAQELYGEFFKAIEKMTSVVSDGKTITESGICHPIPYIQSSEADQSSRNGQTASQSQ
jgi:transcriptional regulator with XRE-family HTH domain